MGFYFEGHYTYLRNYWNIIDFGIVVLGWISFSIEQSGGSASNLSTFRVIRVLRPLRAVKSIPGLGLMIASLLRSTTQLFLLVYCLASSFLWYVFLSYSICPCHYVVQE